MIQVPEAPVVKDILQQQSRTYSKRFARLAGLVEKQYNTVTAQTGRIPFALRTGDGEETGFGGKQPAFTIILKNGQAISALSTLDQNTIVEAYLADHIDLEGDIMSVLALRELFNDNRGTRFLWRFIQPFLFGQVKSDKKWIAGHYDIDAEFFTCFLDRRHRAYSQAIYLHDDEALEDAVTRKFEFVLEAVKAKPGDEILDIGSGWGAFVAYAGKRGIQVTSLTISTQSQIYVQELIDREQLPCRVLLEHFMEHNPNGKYDAIVNCGVTEHLPDYAGSIKHYGKLLKPGGYLYLDASADRVKHGHGSFMSKYVYGGNATLLCLHQYLAEVAKSPFRLLGVWDDRHSYYLTTQAWAQNFDRHREEIEQRWGKQLYRVFQLYLWGSAEGFQSGMIDAYRIVLHLPEAQY